MMQRRYKSHGKDAGHTPDSALRTPTRRRGPTTRIALIGGLAALALAGIFALAPLRGDDNRALLLEIDGIIGPATSDFFIRGLDKARDDNASLVIIRMNTPGGLDTSMREIIKHILASPVPVVSYVSPPGSRAASAGTYILYASHVAAMAPATNLGAATPVKLAPGGIDTPKPPEPENKEDKEKTESDAPKGGAMERKIVNDAVAYIRGLAKLRGRNADWAEKAVREGVSLTAEDALEAKVIDLVAKDVDDLMTQLQGRTVTIRDDTVALETEGMKIEILEPDWRNRILGIITNPNVAYILMLLGIYGLFFELSNPGAIFPGVVGGICILLALYAFHVLPVDYAGIALILLGIALMVAELFAPSFGILGIGGAVAFVIGSMILIDTEIEAFRISIPLIVAVAIVTALFVFTIVSLAIKQRNKPIVSGKEEMLGSIGEATSAFDEIGQIRIHGELWEAKSKDPVGEGQKVRVYDMQGLTLLVEPLKKENSK